MHHIVGDAGKSHEAPADDDDDHDRIYGVDEAGSPVEYLSTSPSRRGSDSPTAAASRNTSDAPQNAAHATSDGDDMAGKALSARPTLNEEDDNDGADEVHGKAVSARPTLNDDADELDENEDDDAHISKLNDRITGLKERISRLTEHQSSTTTTYDPRSSPTLAAPGDEDEQEQQQHEAPVTDATEPVVPAPEHADVEATDATRPDVVDQRPQLNDNDEDTYALGRDVVEASMDDAVATSPEANESPAAVAEASTATPPPAATLLDRFNAMFAQSTAASSSASARSSKMSRFASETAAPASTQDKDASGSSKLARPRATWF